MVLNSRPDQGQEHGDSHTDRADDSHHRYVLQCSRDGEHETHERRNHLEDDCALRVVGKGVQNLASGKYVETSKENVVENQHDGTVCERRLALCWRQILVG